MRHRHGGAVTDSWQAMFDKGDWLALAHALLTDHYDPAYDSSVSRHNRPVLATIGQPDCTPPSVAESARAILSLPVLRQAQ